MNRKQTPWRGLLAALVTLPVLLTSCGGGWAADHQFVVELETSGKLDPGYLRIPAGSTVAWHNKGLEPRRVIYKPGLVETEPTRPPGSPNLTEAVSLPDGTDAWESRTLYQGETFRYTFERPGAYVYVSPYPLGFSGAATTASGAYSWIGPNGVRFTDQTPAEVPIGVILVYAGDERESLPGLEEGVEPNVPKTGRPPAGDPQSPGEPREKPVGTP